MPVRLTVRGLVKTFPDNGVRACDGIDLDWEAGQVHAVLGENGAGKTTLMRLLAGLLEPDEGQILLNGQPLTGGSEPYRRGIALVQQIPPWSAELRLWEHALLGREGGLFLRPRQAVKDLQESAAAWGLDLPWTELCGRLPQTVLQKATLAAYLRLPLQVLILDEPTATLPQAEADQILRLMVQVSRRENGPAVVFITHQLTEALTHADRLTVLAQGRVLRTMSPDQTTEAEVRRLMFHNPAGIDIPLHQELPAAPPPQDSEPVLLAVQGLHWEQEDRVLLDQVSFQVHRGEIVGLCSLRGEGIEALEEVLAGLEEPDQGTLDLDGQPLHRADIALRRRHGMAYVPSDRIDRGTSAHSSLASNLIPYRLKELSNRGRLRRRGIQEFFQSLKNRFSLAGEARQKLSTLSGGNIQKVILARELEAQPRLLLLADPAWGLDAAARASLYQTLGQAAAGGCAVILLGNEARELAAVCHRLGILYRGRLGPLRPAGAWTADQIDQALLGDSPSKDRP